MRLSHDETRNPIHPEYVIWHTENYLDCHRNLGHNSMFFDVHGSGKSSFITIYHKTSRIRPILVKHTCKIVFIETTNAQFGLIIWTVVFFGDGASTGKSTQPWEYLCVVVGGGEGGGGGWKKGVGQYTKTWCESLEARMRKKRPLGEQHLDTYRWYALKRHNKEGIRYFRSATYFL